MSSHRVKNVLPTPAHDEPKKPELRSQNISGPKGAFDFSADFAYGYGWAHLQMSLIEIKEEARILRELKKIKTWKFTKELL